MLLILHSVHAPAEQSNAKIGEAAERVEFVPEQSARRKIL
jgi:hypothetical protein